MVRNFKDDDIRPYNSLLHTWLPNPRCRLNPVPDGKCFEGIPVSIEAIKSLRITRRVLFILGGLFLIMMGVDFLENPVRFGTRAQYDLRGWLKYVAAAACFYPGAYAVIVGLTPSSWDRKSKDD